MNWIVVSDWKDIPEGMWLVNTDRQDSFSVSSGLFQAKHDNCRKLFLL